MKVTRVRIEYDDGSAREVVGVDDCEKWTTLVNAHTTLWLSRGWDPPALVNWREIPAPRAVPMSTRTADSIEPEVKK